MNDQTAPQGWKTTPFSKCLAPTRARGGKLFARDYQASGRFPVIDQGQRQIAGWTDNESLVIQNDLPYVVFGDHTRAFKFVAEPFVLGADGTQLLKPAAQFNPRFFFYACLHLDIPNRGYNRHFILLKERDLPQPTTSEQEKIAAVLWKTQRAAELEEKLTATARELKFAAMHRLFSSGLHNEPLKETEVGPVPKSWDIRPVGDLCTISTGGTPSKERPDFWRGSIPWVSPKDLKRPRLTDVVDHITEEALDSGSNLAPAGTILIVVRGMILVKDVPIALLERPMAFNQDLKALVSRGDIQPDYLLYALTAFKSQLFQKIGMSAHGTRTLVGTSIADTCLPVPPGEEQRAIAVALQTIDRKIALHERRAVILRELFASLLHRLMTGEVRVDKLDIDVSEVRA